MVLHLGGEVQGTCPRQVLQLVHLWRGVSRDGKMVHQGASWRLTSSAPKDRNFLACEGIRTMEVSDMTNSVSPSFFSRVFSNDAAKKGVAGAIAGMLVAVVTEVLWPNNA
jgi:hypothetical protein